MLFTFIHIWLKRYILGSPGTWNIIVQNAFSFKNSLIANVQILVDLFWNTLLILPSKYVILVESDISLVIFNPFIMVGGKKYFRLSYRLNYLYIIQQSRWGQKIFFLASLVKKQLNDTPAIVCKSKFVVTLISSASIASPGPTSQKLIFLYVFFPFYIQFSNPKRPWFLAVILTYREFRTLYPAMQKYGWAMPLSDFLA